MGLSLPKLPPVMERLGCDDTGTGTGAEPPSKGGALPRATAGAMSMLCMVSWPPSPKHLGWDVSGDVPKGGERPLGLSVSASEGGLVKPCMCLQGKHQCTGQAAVTHCMRKGLLQVKGTCAAGRRKHCTGTLNVTRLLVKAKDNTLTQSLTWSHHIISWVSTHPPGDVIPL